MITLNTIIMIEQHAEEDILTHDGMEDIGGQKATDDNGSQTGR